MMLERFLCLIIGYGLGCLLTAELVSYAISHESIQEKGSHNPGMTNALRLYGKKAGLIVLVGDLLKTADAYLICELLFPMLDHLAILLLCLVIFALMLEKSFASLCKIIRGTEMRGLWFNKKV